MLEPECARPGAATDLRPETSENRKTLSCSTSLRPETGALRPQCHHTPANSTRSCRIRDDVGRQYAKSFGDELVQFSF